MTRTMLLALAATTTVGGGLSMLFGQGTPVELQPSTPGTQQVGNANVSGRIIASSVHATDPSPTGQAIVGSATSTSGANFGGFFRSDSPLGRALYGRAAATSGTTSGVYGQSDSPAGRGVTGVVAATSGNATGVWGQTASVTGRGVYGYTTSTSGVNYGVFGQSLSPVGFGVYSQGNLHATGVISGNGSGLTGVNAAQLGGLLPSAFLQSIPNPLQLTGASGDIIKGTTTSTSGAGSGVYGFASSATGSGVGVRGRSESAGGRGVYGIAAHTTGANFGGHFISASDVGIGAYGQVTATTGLNYGGFFRSASPAGRGLFAETTSLTGDTLAAHFKGVSINAVGMRSEVTSPTGLNYGGVFNAKSVDARAMQAGVSATTGVNYGVFGWTNSAAGYGVFSGGNTGASGSKSFRIDHPFDPENKYLLHYATESPTPQNFYVGNVVTDAEGYAWVELPDYFGEINKNFKYQLTIVDDRDSKGFAMAKVSKKIRDGRFQIRTSEPNVEVSWRVDADRNDLYMRNRPAMDVVDKPAVERGTYQHPEFYGFGPERGLTFEGLGRRQQSSPAPTRTR